MLYIGGIAELFLAGGDDEVLYARQRKGFIKPALRGGAEVVPIYFFGNTSVLSVLSTAALRSPARLTGVTLTWFCRRGTARPRPRKILGVLGKPLGMPSTPIPEPMPAEVDRYHALYLREVERIFESYKALNPDYAGKRLVSSEHASYHGTRSRGAAAAAAAAAAHRAGICRARGASAVSLEPAGSRARFHRAGSRARVRPCVVTAATCTALSLCVYHAV